MTRTLDLFITSWRQALSFVMPGCSSQTPELAYVPVCRNHGIRTSGGRPG
jgi:hypothetical protein